jgi:hypothetical protein
MASSYITRTSAGTGNQKKGTWSAWIKKGNDSYGVVAEESIFGHGADSSNLCSLIINSSGQMELRNKASGSYTVRNKTNRQFKDASAFYHIVVQYDTTQSTEADRLKLFVNNEQITSWAETNWPTLNEDLKINTSGEKSTLGRQVPSNGDYFRGTMSHVYWLDGVIAAPTVFGGYNATDGMWEINTSPTISSYGTNGFCLKLENSSNLDQDTGTNGFTFTTSGELTASKDNPSNSFCTLNCQVHYGSGISTFNDASTQFVGSQGNAWRIVAGTTLISKGKYYYEVKINTASANNSYSIGWMSTDRFDPSNTMIGYIGDQYGPAFGLMKDGQINYSTTTSDSQADTGWTSYTNGGDIICCAIDLDNLKAYYGLNGVWMKSGDPTSGSTGTGAFSISNAGYNWIPAFGSSETASGSTCHMSANFGQGFFGNVSGAPTAVASAGTNASGNGTFEFDVPTGYTALCTKGINS